MATKTKTKSTSAAELDFEILAGGLKIMQIACGATPTVTLTPTKLGTQLLASQNGSEASYLLPYTISGHTGLIEVPTDLLQDALKGRKTGSLAVKDSVLTVTSGRYSSVIYCAEQGVELEFPIPDGAQTVIMTPSLHAFLLHVLPLLRIERTHANTPDVQLSVRINTAKSSVYAATYDPFQFCWTSRKIAKGESLEDLQLALPYTRFAQLVKDLPVANCKLIITAETLLVLSKQFSMRLALPAIDEDSALDPNVAYAKGRELDKTTGEEGSFDIASVKALLENGRSLLQPGTSVKMTPHGKSTQLLLAGARGEVKALSAGYCPEPGFGVDYRYLQTLLQQNPASAETPSLTYSVIDGSMLVGRGQNVNYVAWLSTAEDAPSEAEE